MRKCTDAVNKNKNDPYIFMSIGKIFWKDQKPVKARKFLNRAAELDKDNGDCWVHLYCFEKEHDQSALGKIRDDFEEAEPHHGDLWCS